MKKILFLILPLFFVLFLAKPSFAQNITGNPLNLAPGTIKAFFTITDSAKDQTLVIPPITSIVVSKNTFSENNVRVFVTEQDFNQVKLGLLPKGQSPIASFYLVFKNSQGKVLTPALPLKLQVINNYVNSLTFFYPLNLGKIDMPSTKNVSGPIVFKADLPINDNGFIVAVNKNLDKNDPSLGYKKLSATTQTNPSFFTKNKDTIMLAGVIIVILATAGGLLFIKKKKPKKRKRIEEPPKIIVGK